jgi:hypothetical protein
MMHALALDMPFVEGETMDTTINTAGMDDTKA